MSATLQVTAGSGQFVSVADGPFDTLARYGYVWLPYAVAVVLLAGLAWWEALHAGSAREQALSRLLPVRIGALALLAAFAAGLADGAAESDGLTAIDRPIWQWAVDHRAPVLTAFFTGVTTVGSTVSMTVLAVVAIGYLAYRRLPADAVLVAVVAIGAGLIVLLGKNVVGRARPPVEYRLVVETNQSFPSGHALASMAILGMLAVLVGRALTTVRARVLLWIGVGIAVLLIGASRVYLGVHWATDVLGGWASGACWLLLCLTVSLVGQALRRRRTVAATAGPT